jgi:hypothetical protein
MPNKASVFKRNAATDLRVRFYSLQETDYTIVEYSIFY